VDEAEGVERQALIAEHQATEDTKPCEEPLKLPATPGAAERVLSGVIAAAADAVKGTPARSAPPRHCHELGPFAPLGRPYTSPLSWRQ
jgi:hypothetical protein